MIKIQYLIHDFSAGGAEKMLLMLLRELDRSSFEPHVCTLLPSGRLQKEFLRLTIPIRCLDLKGYTDLPRALRDLYRLLMQHKIVVLHTYLFYADILGRIAGKLAHIPVISSMRNTDDWRKMHHVLLDRFTSRWTQGIIANTAASYTRLTRREMIPKKKLYVVYNAIDTSGAGKDQGDDGGGELRKALGLEYNTTVLLSIGRLEHQKDHETLLRGMKVFLDTRMYQENVHKADSRVKLLIAGEGRLRKNIEQLIKKWGLSPYVSLLGYRKDTDKLMALCDIFILSSKYEGLPNVVLEALARGKHVVSTHYRGIEELFYLAKTSRYDLSKKLVTVPVGDSTLLGKQLCRLTALIKARTPVGENGYHIGYLEKNFSIQEMVYNTVAVYSRILKEAASASNGGGVTGN